MIQCSKCGHKHSTKYAMQEKSCCLKCGEIINLDKESYRLWRESYYSICSVKRKNYIIGFNHEFGPITAAFVAALMVSFLNFLYISIASIFFIYLYKYLFVSSGSISIFLFVLVVTLCSFIFLSCCLVFIWYYSFYVDEFKTTSLHSGSHALDIIESMLLPAETTIFWSEDSFLSLKDEAVYLCNELYKMKYLSLCITNTLRFAGKYFSIINLSWIITLTCFVFIFTLNYSIIQNEYIFSIFNSINNFFY